MLSWKIIENNECLIFFRLAEFTSTEGEKDRLKKGKPSEQIQSSLADRFNQLHDAENAWKKKVSEFWLIHFLFLLWG